MPYILNKTNGTIVATVQDASLDLTTDLSFVGRNYAGYGEIQNENFLKLLENFANSTSPAKPIDGQIWYNSTTKQLNIYDGSNWKGVSNLQVSAESPDALQNFEQGDLWFNTTEEQLHVYNGSSFILVGPLSGADSRAQWRGSYEYSKEEEGLPKYNIKAVVGSGNEVIAIVSADFYELSQDLVSPSFPIYPGTTVLKKGITLVSTDNDNGVTTTASGTIIWGTATSAQRLVDIADSSVFYDITDFVLKDSPTFTTSVTFDSGFILGAVPRAAAEIANGADLLFRTYSSSSKIILFPAGSDANGVLQIDSESVIPSSGVNLGSNTNRFYQIFADNIAGTSVVGAFFGNLTGNVTGNVAGNVTGNLTGNVAAGSGTIATTNFTITEVGGVLYFKNGLTNIAKLDASGNFTALGNVTAFGSV
jgi:hypothetical protein